MTPPKAARKAPRPNMRAETIGTFIPIPLAISLSSTVARSFAPKEVFSLNTHSAMATAIEREITNNLYVGKMISPIWREPCKNRGAGNDKGSPPQIRRAKSLKIRAKPMVIRTCGKCSKYRRRKKRCIAMPMRAMAKAAPRMAKTKLPVFQNTESPM